MVTTPAVETGLERLLRTGGAGGNATASEIAAGARIGLLMNQASVDRDFRYAHHRLAGRFPGQLGALFSPQHGITGEAQDNMVETAHGRDPDLGVPVYSLYAESREPAPEMLAGLDWLVVDLQDVGTRVYTFAWTVSLCLEACARAGVGVLVLDRPNPLGGERAEGPRLDPAFASFVGRAPVPMRHGLTLGELALHLNRRPGAGARLEVIPLGGWGREMRWGDTGLTWVPPSPNLPRTAGVEVYPGMVVLEGTWLSEGRGTTTPFEVFGAPYIDPPALLEELAAFGLGGVVFRPVRFLPTFQKHAGESCGGLALHVTDPDRFEPYRTGLAVVAAVRRCWPGEFSWRPPPYEYEETIMPFDLLTGSNAAREAIDAGAGPGEIGHLAALDEAGWWAEVDDVLLYPRRDGRDGRPRM